MSAEQRYTASFHGHSPFSDGVSPIPELVRVAAQAKVTYFGISDHCTLNGARELYEQIAIVNDNLEVNMIPVSAVEITTSQGDLVVAKPGKYDQGFVDWGNRWGERRHQHALLETIGLAVNHFGAIAVIVHPAETLLSSASIGTIRQLVETLDYQTLTNVGLEVHNWSTKLLPIRTRFREWMIGRLATNINLAQFGFSDFHSSWIIPKQLTCAYLPSPTPEEFITAVQQRRVYPSQERPISPADWLRLAHAVTRARLT